MTVCYSRSVATFRQASLVRLLFRWRGSVYKAVWPTFIAFLFAYILIALIYYLLPSHTVDQIQRKRMFVQVCAYVGRMSNAIPVSFVLGFFVNVVVDRWWKQFLNLPTPDSVCLLMTTFLREQPKVHTEQNTESQTDKPLLYRRTIARYLNLSCALCFYTISLSLRRQITNLEDLVYCGLMTKQEHDIYLELSQDNSYFFIPLVWAITLLTRAHHEGMIRHERYLDAMVTAVVDYWRQLQTLFLHDYVNIPLVYNQVVTLVVYVYLGTLVISHQFADPTAILDKVEKELKRSANFSLESSSSIANRSSAVDYNIISDFLNVTPNVPVFAFLMLIFYTGWLRVAEANVFPFGEDDDDFEVIPLLERNISSSVWIVGNSLATESEIQELIRLNLGPEGDVKHGVPSWLADALNQETMGWKRSRRMRSIVTGAEAYRGSTVAVSEEESAIPELPCPSELRRRSSKYFFTGSMARLHEEEAAASQGRKASQNILPPLSDLPDCSEGNFTSPNLFGSVGLFVERVGRRISETFALQPRTNRTSLASTHCEDAGPLEPASKTD